MPELPEVETIRRDLMAHLLGSQILVVKVIDSRVIRSDDVRKFVQQVRFKSIANVVRYGKAIVVQLNHTSKTNQKVKSSAGFLTVQPMMTGQLILVAEDQTKTRITGATKVVFILSNQQSLLYNDHRLFGRINFYHHLSEFDFLKTLGPDPFSEEFTQQWLGQSLRQRTAPIKSLLLDQRLIAGIGNIYASEILFGCSIHPKRPANTLSLKEVFCLKQKTIEILTQAIECRGTSMNTYVDGYGYRGKFIEQIKVYGKEGLPCPQCQYPIARIVQAGRSSFFCNQCQL